MKALTVWQPWASLIILGFKPYEFRGHRAPASFHGLDIGVHAGARPVKYDEVKDLVDRLRGPEAWTTCLKPEALPFLEKVLAGDIVLPRSHVLGTVNLGVPKRGYEIVGEFGAVLNDSDRDDHCNWAWPMNDVRPLMPPVPAKGAQGFWNWSGGHG